MIKKDPNVYVVLTIKKADGTEYRTIALQKNAIEALKKGTMIFEDMNDNKELSFPVQTNKSVTVCGNTTDKLVKLEQYVGQIWTLELLLKGFDREIRTGRINSLIEKNDKQLVKSKKIMPPRKNMREAMRIGSSFDK